MSAQLPPGFELLDDDAESVRPLIDLPAQRPPEQVHDNAPTPQAFGWDGKPQQVWRSENGVMQPVDLSTVNWTATPVIVSNTSSSAALPEGFELDLDPDPYAPPPGFELEPEPNPFAPPPGFELEPERNFGDVSQDVMNQFARGATSDGGIFSGIEGAARLLGNRAEDRMEGRDTIAKGEDGKYHADIWQGARQGVADFLLPYADDTANLRTDIREALPVSEAFQNSLAGQIVAGFGQVPANLAAYSIPGLGPITSVGQLYDETYQDAVAHGADVKKAHEAGLLAIPAGAIDIVMDKFMIGKILKPLKGKITVGQLAKTFSTTAVAGGSTEAMQQTWQNFIANYLSGYDPNRKLDDDVLKSFLVGMIVDSTVSTGGQALMNQHAKSVEQAPDPSLPPLEKPINGPTRLEDIQVQGGELDPDLEAEFLNGGLTEDSLGGSAERLIDIPNSLEGRGNDNLLPQSRQLNSTGVDQSVNSDGSRPDVRNSAQTVKSWVDGILKDWRVELRVAVHDSASAIPDTNLRQSVMNSGAVEAFFNPDDQNIHILADRVATPADAERLLRHEGMHWLFNGPMRGEYLDILEGVARTMGGPGVKKAMRIVKAYPGAGPAVWMEEYLAYEGQNNPKSSTWRKFVYEVKRVLQRMFGDRVQFNEADVMSFLNKANSQLEMGEGTAVTQKLRFAKTLEDASTTPARKRGFVESVQRSEKIEPSLKELVQGIYTPITNVETVAKAREWINVRGIDGARADLMGRENPTALDYAAGIDLIGRMQGLGMLDESSELIERMSEQATSQGQAIQALSLLAKLTSEGVQVYAARVVAKAIKKDKALAERHSQITKLKQELRKVRKQLATVALLNAKRRGTNEAVLKRINRLMVENKGSLWGRYKQQAVSQLAQKMVPVAKNAPPWLQEFTGNLTRHLREQLKPLTAPAGTTAPQMTEAEAIGHAIRNFDKYQEVWNQAQAYMKARYKDDPATLKALDDYFGQILEKPFSPDSVDRALRQALDTMKLSMREVLMQGGADKEKTREELERLILDGAKVSKAEAMGLADSVQHAFETQQRLEREKLLKQMTSLTGTHKIPQSKLQKLIGLNNAGALDDTRFFAALSSSYGVPAWTPELSAKVQKLQQEADRATDPMLKTAKHAQMFDAIHEAIPSDVLLKTRGVMNLSMLLNSMTWSKNIVGNAAMFVGNVPADAVALVIDSGVGVITGKRTRRSLDIGARVEGLGAAWAEFKKGYDFSRESGSTFKTNMAEGLDTMLTLARLSSQGKWDISQINRGSGRVFSSSFMRALEDTLSLALAAPDRMFHQAAFLASIRRQMKVAEKSGQQLIAPTAEMIEEAMADAARAVFQGDNFVNRGLVHVAKGLNTLTTGSDRFGLGSVVLPFVQVPAGLLIEGVRWTPIGFIKPMLNSRHLIYSRDRFDQKSFSEDFSRALTGTAVPAALGFWLFKMAILTAAGEEDDDLNAMMEDSGFGKYRVNISALKRMLLSGSFWKPQQPQEGDIIWNYDWLQPIAMSVAYGAEYAHQQDVRGRSVKLGKDVKRILPEMMGNAAEDAAASTLAATGSLENLSVLSGLSKLAGNIARKRSMADGLAVSALDGPSMFIPSMLTRINMLLDNVVRETRAGSPVDQAVARMESKIPGLSSNFPPKYDVFGEAVERYAYGGNSFFNVMLNPVMEKKFKASPQLLELRRVFAETGDARIMPRKVPVTLQFGGQKVELTNEQISEYQRLTGTLTMAGYARLAASPQYARYSVVHKANALARVMESSSAQAKIKLMDANSDRRLTVDDPLMAKVMQQKQQGIDAKRQLLPVR